MKSALVFIGLASLAAAQVANPKWITPTQASFVELTAYNIQGYTPQQLWGYRNVEKIVKFDTNMNCVYEGYKSNGVEQQYDAFCWSKDIHWKANANPQCTQGSRSFSVADSVKQFWSYYSAFTVYQGQVNDPYYSTNVMYHRYKHST